MIVKRKVIREDTYERVTYSFGLGVCNYCKYYINMACRKKFNKGISFCGFSIFMITARKTKTAFDLTKLNHAYRISQE